MQGCRCLQLSLLQKPPQSAVTAGRDTDAPLDGRHAFSFSFSPRFSSSWQVLLDIGAGLGLFSLSAAARGHRVIAMEASPPSSEALQESLTFNGWGKLVTLHRAPAGSVDGHPVCLEREGVHDAALASGYSSAEVQLLPAVLSDWLLQG